jgi:ABC-type siderophore export system fused ATPase/permease subunit
LVFCSLAVKEFNSKTNICFTTTILFLKRALVVCLGCTFTFLVILILSLTLSPHYFEKHILEVDSAERYDIQSILSDVYLKCETNDIIGLLGRNGSGKSTLLKIIFGIENADFKCELTKL